MNLLKLRTNNWRNFYGEHELVFSNEKDKHVTLIHGQNGTGKTTMINAIKWCLYGVTPDFDKELNIVNNIEIAHWDTWKHKNENGKIIRTAPHETESEFEVELIFEHDGIEYRATRSAHQKDIKGKAVAPGKDTFCLFKKNSSGQQKLIDEPNSAISNILPSELADYFLFSGEVVGKMLDSKGSGYKNAVRDILGFTLSDIAIKDLEYISVKNTRQKNALIQADKLTKSFGDDLIKLHDDKKEISSQLADLGREYREAKEAHALIVKQISESGHDKVNRLGKDLKEKELLKEGEEKRKKDFLNEKIDLIEKYGFAIFGAFLEEEVKPLQKEKHEGRLPSGIRDSFINKLIKEEECICGTTLKKNEKEYNRVVALLDTANTSLIDDRLTKAFGATAFFKGRAKSFISNLDRISKQIEKSESLIGSYSRACLDINAKLKGLGDVNIDKLLADRDKLKTAMQKKTFEVSTKQVILNTKETEIARIHKELKKVKNDNPELERKKNFARVVEVAMRRLHSNQEKHERESRDLITQSVQSNMSDFSHNDFVADVDEDYKVGLTVSGTNTKAAGVGEGTEMLSKLSFISSLVSHSTLRKGEKSSWAAPGAVAPFVVDAPFAEMDGDTRWSALKFLPKQSHQLILFLSNGQWDERFEEVIGDYIGKRYYYKNHVKPGGKLTQKPLPVKGREYSVEIDDWDKNHYGATIEEL